MYPDSAKHPVAMFHYEFRWARQKHFFQPEKGVEYVVGASRSFPFILNEPNQTARCFHHKRHRIPLFYDAFSLQYTSILRQFHNVYIIIFFISQNYFLKKKKKHFTFPENRI